jgi:hypothetical protein
MQTWWEKAWQQKYLKITYHCKNQVQKLKVETQREGYVCYEENVCYEETVLEMMLEMVLEMMMSE